MEITEVKVKLVDADNVDIEDVGNDKLLAYCTITIDTSFVIRDIKIISSPNGPFIAMPSRKLMDRCEHCGGKNHLRARHCNDCGGKLNPGRASSDRRGRPRMHADVAHPIHSQARERLHTEVIRELDAEVARVKAAR